MALVRRWICPKVVKKRDLELSGDQDFGVIWAEDIWTSIGSPRVRVQK